MDPQDNPGVSGVYISADPGFAEILPGEVRAKEIVVKTCEYILSANSNIPTEVTQPDSTRRCGGASSSQPARR